MAVKKPPVYNRITPDDNSDPSSLTMQLVLHEVASLKELLTERMSGVEKGIEVAHEDLVRVPTEVQQVVGSTQILFDTKIFYEHKLAKMHFEFICKQLNWMEVMRVEQKNDMKELANKNEIAASKQVDGLAELVNRGLGNLNDKFNDQRNMFTVSDSTSKGKSAGVAQVVAIAGAVAAIVGTIVGLMMKYLLIAGK